MLICVHLADPRPKRHKKKFQQKVRITLIANISTCTLVRDLNPCPDYQTFSNLVSHFLKLCWVFLSISEISQFKPLVFTTSKGGRGRACINFEIARCKNNHFSLQNMDIIYIRGIRQWRRGTMAIAVLSPEGARGAKMWLSIHILKCS